MATFADQNSAERRRKPGLNLWAGVALALALVFTGCSGLTGVRLGSYIDDANLSKAVAERFAAEKNTDFARVKTEVKSGVIYLSGTVASDEQRSRAEKVAFQVPGTKGVVNNLQVEKP
jgi:osmotically-inducible protein OsmY